MHSVYFPDLPAATSALILLAGARLRSSMADKPSRCPCISLLAPLGGRDNPDLDRFFASGSATRSVGGFSAAVRTFVPADKADVDVGDAASDA